MKEIELTQGKVAIVDDRDFELLSAYKWTAHDKNRKTFYAVRLVYPNGKYGAAVSIKMHRLILGVNDPDVWVDHIDGNGLNNTRENLRVCTRAENQQNRGANRNNKSGFKGVIACKRSGKWIAKIMANRKSTHIGRFDTPEEAHAAYVRAAESLHWGFNHFKTQVRS